jgi:uncharacterized membrane protein
MVFLVWLHVLAAVSWIGGMIFLSLVLAPLVRVRRREAGGKSRMKESYKVRLSQSPWPRVMRVVGQPTGRSVHRGTTGLCMELRKHPSAVADLVLTRGRQ